MTKQLCAWVGPHMRLPPHILTDLDMEIETIPDITQLIQHMNQHTWQPHLLIFDSHVLCESDQVTAWDILQTLNVITRTVTKPHSAVWSVWVTSDTKVSTLKQLMPMGIHGVVPDPQHWGELQTKKALGDLLNNIQHWPKSVMDVPIKGKIIKSSTPKLTNRQSQVMQMIMTSGASNKVIARNLKISESTVKVHIGAILRKYGVRNRTQLALCGLNGRL
jgi:DNA-binding NarL/FixJ family response regulator